MVIGTVVHGNSLWFYGSTQGRTLNPNTDKTSFKNMALKYGYVNMEFGQCRHVNTAL